MKLNATRKGRQNSTYKIIPFLFALIGLLLFTACGAVALENPTRPSDTARQTQTTRRGGEDNAISLAEYGKIGQDRKGNDRQREENPAAETSPEKADREDNEEANQGGSRILKGEAYYDRDDVAEYIALYGELPPNYITKQESREMRWSPDDNDGLVVGGDRFGNREGLLPKASGRQYYEADLISGYTDLRGTERIIFSNDGLIFYTDDHYESFTQLYGRED